MAFMLDMRDLMSSGAKYRIEREKPVRLAVLVDAEAPDAAVDALKDALRPQTGFARLHIEPVVPGDVLEVDAAADAVIGLVGPGTTLAESLKRSRERAIPTVVLALGHGRDDVARRIQHPFLDTLVEEDADGLILALGAWLEDRVSEKRLALAANFAFVRRAVAEEAIKSTSFQNAVIGGVAIIPGADMPLMTANQAKMVMQIAAAYGEPLGVERIKELGAVVGGALLLRTVARQFVGLIPGFGWAIKAGIGYSGTLAMGYAALEYFEQGGDVQGLAERIRSARDKAVESARRKRGLPTEAPIEATWTPAGASASDVAPSQTAAPAVLPAVSGQPQSPPEGAR